MASSLKSLWHIDSYSIDIKGATMAALAVKERGIFRDEEWPETCL